MAQQAAGPSERAVTGSRIRVVPETVVANSRQGRRGRESVRVTRGIPLALPEAMRFRLACASPLLLLAACGEIAPPLEQLPLRDTLRADPEVVAALDDGARRSLADRLLLTPVSEATADPVDDPGAPPQELVGRLDRARERRGQDALVTGVLDGGGVVGALPEAAPAAKGPLPPLEAGDGPAPTLGLEARALGGRAERQLRTLLDISGAHHLKRVVGWPVGAIAIGDNVYVSAAWLVALAPSAPADAGAGFDTGMAPATPPPAGETTAATTATAAGEIRTQAAAQNDGRSAAPTGYDGGVTIVSPLSAYDGGVYIPPPAPVPPPTPVSSGDDCAAACAAGSSSSDDCSSSSGGDDCSSTDDGSGSDCSSSTDDGSSCETSNDEGEGCQVARGRRHDGKGTWLTLAMPLAFLLPRRRR